MLLVSESAGRPDVWRTAIAALLPSAPPRTASKFDSDIRVCEHFRVRKCRALLADFVLLLDTPRQRNDAHARNLFRL